MAATHGGNRRRIALGAWACLQLAVGAALAAEPAAWEKPVRFSRDIQPILARSCYACHGPDASNRQADLRLDVRAEAVKSAIVPGKAQASPLWQRISSKDPDDRMPPPESKKPALEPGQIELIRRWIDEGAPFDQHWAYVKPQPPAVPKVENTSWPLNPIDRFIADGHRRHGLQPAPEADRRTLIRRLSFDLVGLPPAPAEVDAFAADASPDAYERLVDRLLASPHYGERMAVYWLDVARFADTCGYHSDNHRELWLYRDWVIGAFNANQPFDQFTIEQLAGDLLPNATRDQRIASGYNRLLQTTEEGGAQAKEYTAKLAADRVRNTGAAWLGSTFGCAECHDHKFDPFTTRDFYCFAAFFADVKESAVGRQEQTKMPSAEQAARLQQLDAQIAPLRKLLDTSTPELEAAQEQWEKSLADHQGLPEHVAAILKTEPSKRSGEQKQALAAYYRGIAPQLASTRDALAPLQRQRDELDASIPTTLITESVAPRVVRLLPRGNWQDDSGEVVEPGVPAFLGSLGVDGRRPTRLDLARWLTSPDHPLVARVFVNRLWRQMFGQGLVKTLDDFGSQGAPPSHPELLDWLAVEFRQSGWNIKRMVKRMAMSRTYRQSSQASKEAIQRDPANLWLARQGRFRLEAEFVRDNALAISGLLAPKIGGPSVKPYQPAGYWAYLNFPPREYVPDRGDNQYRRGLYTYWQRTFLHPSLLAFDASTREECTVERPRSNTPLQALVLLNDPTYVEAARALATRMMRQGGTTDGQRVQFALRHALAREALPEETAALLELYQKHLAQYARDEKAARELLQVGDAKAPDDLRPAELAAWTSVARAVLNLHETITRE